MDDVSYHDLTGRCCPDCGSKVRLYYTDVPAHRRIYTDAEGAEVTEFFPPQRDYICRNCDTEWTMGEPE